MNWPEGPGSTDAPPVAGSAVFEFRARPGREQALAQWAHRIVSAARQCEGNIAATVIGPDQTGGYRVLQHFRDQAALESWLSSSQRAELLREANQLLERPPSVRRTGLETWFHLPSDGPAIVPPPRWKMWLTSVVAIYPLLLAFLVWVISSAQLESRGPWLWGGVPFCRARWCWSSRDDDGAAAVEAVGRRLQKERSHIRA